MNTKSARNNNVGGQDPLLGSKSVKSILDRLSIRSELRKLAVEIIDGLSAAEVRLEHNTEQMFVGELEPITICHDSPSGSDEARFVCTADYSCSSSPFSCPSRVTYETCDSVFVCDTGYDCNKEYYDCRLFVCQSKKFTCDEDKDYICGNVYICKDEFECSSDHIFVCADDHECEDDFTCSNTGKDPKCNYNWGGDTTPGDFECGMITIGSDDFDCTNNFDCSSKSDFECTNTTDFDCDDFDCGNDYDCGDTHNCENDFTCSGTKEYFCDDDFDCGSASANDFDCKTDFSCGGGTWADDDFDCNGDFDCPSDFDCPDTFNCEGDFDCTSYDCVDTFNCSSSDFTCSGTYCP